MKSIQQLMNLTGRVALITGGGGHIGRAVASALAEVGAAIAITDKDEEACARASAELAHLHGREVLSLPVDLVDDDSLARLPGVVASQCGGLDILVHCAAFVGTSELTGWNEPFERQSLATWRKVLDVNLASVFHLTQAAVPALRVSRKGVIINVSSIYGLHGPDLRLYQGTGMNNPAAYAASKGGLIQFTRWCATVLAPDIRVNALVPGGVFRNQDPHFVERYIERTPLQRMATEEDFKGAACYLASDLSAYVTGQCLVVDGGWGVW
jgi:NAD(P)-dependent dehydrogenase (short-subunit alcohol dehydrogenase family)